MAVLKDLIVHGPSRFINGAKFNTINAESIGASEGIFNKLVATTLDAREATIDNLTAENAKVVGMLDVEGELHTNSWTNANIANIGGSFYISPTVEAVTGTISITRTETSGVVSWTVTASGKFATDFIKSGTSTTGVTWTANSLVLITGNITLNNLEYPLGTLKGTLNSPVTASAASTSKNITITGVTDAQNNTTVLQELYELNGNSNISGATFSNGKISLYKLGSYPIGIQLSSMGVDSNSIIEIYGGVKSTPTVRIGHLAGLPAINGSAPTGWGIYTDNGYFSGVIVSNSGKIGNFTITNDLHSGTTGIGKDTNVYVSPGTNSSIAIANSPVNLNWAFTAGNKFGVTTAGDLYATGAKINGKIEATELTISSGGTTYSGVSAINANGYSIQIVEDKSAAYSSATMGDNNTYLYPILFLNGVKVETGIVYTNFIWFLDGATTGGTQGHSSNGGIVAEYGHTYRVTYSVDDTAVGEVQPSTYINVDPSKYITRIADNGITIHPETMATNSNYIHIDGNSLMVKRQVGTTAVVNTDAILASFGTTAQIGQNGSSRFLMNSDSLQAYDGDNSLYFEVDANGLTWGSGNTAATTTQVNSAAQTANNYITEITGNGIRIHPTVTDNNSVVLNSNGLEIFKGGTAEANSIAFYGDYVRIGKNNTSNITLTATGSNAGITLWADGTNGNAKKILAEFATDATYTPTTSEGLPMAAWFTLGYRTGTTGYYSLAGGYNVVAKGWASFGYGINCQAYGDTSFAIGSECRTGASDAGIHQGDSNLAGWCSAAIGSSCVAHGNSQVVIGGANRIDTAHKYVFIVGKGTNTARSDALNLDWNGQLTIASTLVQSSDRRLKDHLSYLNKDAIEFIQKLKPAHFIKDEEHHVGFYAQDVEEVDPWHCMTGEMNGFKTLGYTEIIAPLVAYCQHLEERIKQLEEK